MNLRSLWFRFPAVLVLVTFPFTATFAVPVAQREFDLVLKRTPDLASGAKEYEICAACHGMQGQGVSDGSVPAIGGQSFQVLAKQLVDFRSGGRTDLRMQHFSGTRHLAISQNIADVAAYISALKPPAPRNEKYKDPEARGGMLYARDCERCHGATGEGKEDWLTPRISAQHDVYLMSQLNDAAAGRRPAMASAHGKLIAALSPNDMAAVIGYIANETPAANAD